MRMSSTALIDLCFRHSAGPGAQVWRHSATIYDHVHVAMWVVGFSRSQHPRACDCESALLNRSAREHSHGRTFSRIYITSIVRLLVLRRPLRAPHARAVSFCFSLSFSLTVTHTSLNRRVRASKPSRSRSSDMARATLGPLVSTVRIIDGDYRRCGGRQGGGSRYG